MSKNITEATKVLRKELARARGVEEGTIVRFSRRKVIRDEMTLRDTNRVLYLSYAAIFVAGKWFLTGTAGVGARSYTNREFLELIADRDIYNVEVAVKFEEV